MNLDLRRQGLFPEPFGKDRSLDLMKTRLRLPFRVKNKLAPVRRPKAEIKWRGRACIDEIQRIGRSAAAIDS